MKSGFFVGYSSADTTEIVSRLIYILVINFIWILGQVYRSEIKYTVESVWKI